MSQTIHASEKILLEPGFRQVYTPPPKADELPVPKGQTLIRAEESCLTKLKKRQRVKPRAVRVRKAAPPTGLTEIELLRILQEHGIGRPATYAGIVEMLIKRAYVTQDENGELHITKRGKQVCKFLTETYPHIFAPTYTARMERALDAIATGKSSYQAVLSGFWDELNKKGH